MQFLLDEKEQTQVLLLIRYEHTKPLKREEVTTVSPAAKTYPSASTDVIPPPGTLEVSTAETEAEDKDQAAAGAGAEDWVNAVEFVPGQPYCGRSKLTSCSTDTFHLPALALSWEWDSNKDYIDLRNVLTQCELNASHQLCTVTLQRT